MTVQIVRDWVVRFNERGPDGLMNTKAPGARSEKLNDAQRKALAQLVESGPIPAIHGVVRWRRKDLVQWLFEVPHFHRRDDGGPRTQGPRLCQAFGRPRHYAQNELEGDVFKKTSPPLWRSGKNARPARISKSGGPTKPE